MTHCLLSLYYLFSIYIFLYIEVFYIINCQCSIHLFSTDSKLQEHTLKVLEML